MDSEHKTDPSTKISRAPKMGRVRKNRGMATVIQKIDPNRHNMRIISHGMRVIRPSMPVIDRESIHRGAPRPCGARPKAAPMLSLLNLT